MEENWGGWVWDLVAGKKGEAETRKPESTQGKCEEKEGKLRNLARIHFTHKCGEML